MTTTIDEWRLRLASVCRPSRRGARWCQWRADVLIRRRYLLPPFGGRANVVEAVWGAAPGAPLPRRWPPRRPSRGLELLQNITLCPRRGSAAQPDAMACPWGPLQTTRPCAASSAGISEVARDTSLSLTSSKLAPRTELYTLSKYRGFRTSHVFGEANSIYIIYIFFSRS